MLKLVVQLATIDFVELIRWGRSDTLHAHCENGILYFCLVVYRYGLAGWH